MDRDLPLVLGLCGPAGTGKSVTAKTLAPQARAETEGFLKMYGWKPLSWTHLAYALPLYRMAAARQKIQGTNVQDRIYYELHAALDDLFRREISYEDLIEMVYDVSLVPCPSEGKPREFLQYVGTEICRTQDSNCFVKWMRRKIQEEFLLFEQEQNKKEQDLEGEPSVRKHLGVAIDDIRFPNECELVKDHPNGILIHLIASDEVRKQRLVDRDGINFRPEALSHMSEKQFDSIPDEWYTQTLDTSDMTIAEQMEEIAKIISKFII